MNSLEKIDILMATYNGEKYIEAQIQSILDQTHQNFCLHISDDKSKDGTKNIIEKYAKTYPDKIKVIQSGENLGAIQNFSFLLSQKTANYVMFSDQDDLWMKDKIEKTYLEMKRLENLHGKELPLLIHTDLTVVDQNLTILGQSFWKYTHLKPYAFLSTSRFLVQNVVTGCTMMMNHPLCQLAKPVPKEALMHDWWIAMTAATFGKIGIVNEPTILYRQHGSNTLGAKKFNLLKLLKKGFIAYFSKNSSLYKNMRAKQAQAKAFFERHQEHLTKNDQIMLKDYIEFSENSWLKKRTSMVKHGFYRSDNIINCILFMAGVQP